MSYKVYNNVFSSTEIQILLEFFNQEDHYVDNRFDVRSKSPPWNSDFPKEIVKTKLDKILDPYEIEEVIFNESKISFRIHVDTGNGHSLIYKNVLIPLNYNGYAATILFDNYWQGPSTRFAVSNISPYRYNIPNKNGKMIWTDDIRELLKQCQTNPISVTDFEVTTKFIKELEQLIEIRNQADNRTKDYSLIKNFKSTAKFDTSIHSKYLYHIPIEDLNGLTLDFIYEWKVGDLLVFDRNQLHCAAAGHTIKTGLSLFVNRAI